MKTKELLVALLTVTLVVGGLWLVAHSAYQHRQPIPQATAYKGTRSPSPQTEYEQGFKKLWCLGGVCTYRAAFYDGLKAMEKGGGKPEEQGYEKWVFIPPFNSKGGKLISYTYEGPVDIYNPDKGSILTSELDTNAGRLRGEPMTWQTPNLKTAADHIRFVQNEIASHDRERAIKLFGSL